MWPAHGNLPLDPEVEDWRRLADSIVAFLSSELADLGPASWEDSSAPVDLPLSGETEQLMSWLGEIFDSGFNTAHPAFLAYIPGGGLVTSALADFIIKVMNRYGTAHFASPRLAQVEQDVIRTFARWVGYPDTCAGVLTTGGSLANFTAVVTARRARLPENFLDGVMYCSDQTHHSVNKAANLAGFSKRNIHILPSDDKFRIVPETLEAQIAEDRDAGLQPFMVVASAGTTNTGSIDPLQALADISERHGLWYHIDAAYGGAFLLTVRGRERLQGVGRADSVTLDPHKGLFLPYGTGSILVKDRDALVQAHELRGEYMPDVDRETAHLDAFSLSVELSREHRGLKVALPLLLHGEQAFSDALDEKLDLAEYTYQQLSAMPELEVLNQPELTTVVFRLRCEAERADAVNRELHYRINAGRKVYVSPTILNDRFVLRISILSHRTHRAQVDDAIAELRRAIGEIDAL